MSTAIAPLGSRFKTEMLDFRGGINNSMNDEAVADNELTAGENYLPEHPNSLILRKRDGLTAISTDLAENVQLIFQGENANYFCSLTKIENVDGTDLDTGLSSSTTWDAASFDTADIFVNGTDKRDTTDGTTFGTPSGSMPAFKFIEEHNNFLFGAGHDLGKLRWSDLGDRDTWSATNELILSDDIDDDITGLAKFRDVLMVFTERRFFLINGFTTTDMEVVRTGHEGPGCTSHRSIIVTNAGVFWWSNQGLVASDDGITTDLPMQRKLKGTLDSLSQANYGLVHGVWNPLHDRIEMFVPTGSTIDLCIYYYYLEDAFFLGTGDGCQMNASGLLNISGLPTIYVGGYSADSATDQIFSRLGDTDIATNITAFMETKRISPAGVTALHQSEVLTLKTGPVPTSGNLTFATYLDDATSTTDSFTVAAVSTVAEDPVRYDRTFNKMKIRIGDALATRPRIRGFILQAFLLND